MSTERCGHGFTVGSHCPTCQTVVTSQIAHDAGIAERLEYLRTQIQGECISYGEIAELEGLAPHIQPGDVELLQWAGVPESDSRVTLVGNETPETPPTIIIGITGGDDEPQVSGVPAGWRVILRDYERGDEPDENGDLYEDTVLIEGGIGGAPTPPGFVPTDLAVSFEAVAIREHFEGHDDEIAEWVAAQTDDVLAAVGRDATMDERIWEAFHDALIDAAKDEQHARKAP